MPNIRILPEVLSNKIAAGEVVERPASVVKELVENAVDAKSSRIFVEVDKGGKTRIRVADNGIGMDRDDSLLALERYATSKIRHERDLFSIGTLGFRGEALPSIASVSDMEIITKTADSDVATRILVKGGHIQDVSEVGAATGTMITVNRLFFNTPARRKYLKTEQTELGQISDTVTCAALARPQVHFRLSHNAKLLADWPPARNPQPRIMDVLGADAGDTFLAVEHQVAQVRVHGFIAPPDVTRKTSRGQYVYVNGRFVRDRVLQHAVMEGYAGRLMKGRFPVAVLFIQLPLEDVDVNVHPTKSTVRFKAPAMVHDLIASGIARALGSADPPGLGRPRPIDHALMSPQHRYALIAESGTVSEPPPAPFQKRLALSGTLADGPEESRPAFSHLTILGQLFDTYIVCESPQGLVLIDQHAAHERVVFEALKDTQAGSTRGAQRMLVPEKLELGTREAAILEGILKDLREIGLELEHFGGTTYLVRAVPSVLIEKPVKPLIMDIIDQAAELGFSSRPKDEVLDGCLKLMACHSAIRANTKLSDAQIKALLQQMDQAQNATHCPHGRPTVIVKSVREIEKAFKRIVNG
ncbi:MAG: DNA mismatch repair endonuclease MutL [Deltaproteobacteria bacterium]|nr:DNA mismatch repair endonuclease MutL [Deltaproteobacteria bacterium]